MHNNRLVLSGSVLAALLILTSQADSAEVSVAPTRIVLTPDQRVGTLTLRNTGNETTEFQVSVKRWTMGATGVWKLDDLGPSESLAVFPLGFHIEPGKAQTIRAGLPRTASIGSERAYRLLVKELPPPRKPDDAPGLRVLSQLSLPIFVNSGSATPTITLRDAGIARRVWTFRLSAEGDGHIDPANGRLQLFNAGGAVVGVIPMVLPYVLAGSAASVAVPLPEGACKQAVRYELEVPSPIGSHAGQLPKDRSCGTR